MVLFITSFLLVFTSSYLLTSVLAPKKSQIGFNYLFLIAFAQIILTFEVLSLFSSIKEFWVLLLNVIFLLISIFIWHKKSKPFWSLDLDNFKTRVINSFKLDRSLLFLFGGFCVFILATVIMCLIMPTTNADANSYHVARSLFWVFNGNLNHITVADVRNICLPINSEILYSWVLLFLKKDIFLGFFSFVGYLLSIFSIYNILGLIGCCTRKKLWVIFILSSFSSVIVQASGTETDIIIAGLVTSSIFLFWYSLKNKEKTPLIMSALAYAIATGTKTPALIAIPGVGLIFLALSIHFYKKDFYKPLLKFLGFGIVFFLIFSSYNYILNYIHYKNIMGSKSFMEVSLNYYGLKAVPANFIKYVFLFFDFTGFRWGDYVGQDIAHVKDFILDFFNLVQYKDGLYSVDITANRMLLEPLMGAGILGFVVFLPCLLWSFVKPIFNRKSKRTWTIFGFAVLFLLNLLILSYLLAYMIFSIRFIMFFMVVSAPILTYSYLKNRNPLKYIILAFSLFYLIGVSTHLWARPLGKIIPIFIKNPSFSALRERAKCSFFEPDSPPKSSTCILRDKIKREYTTDNRILALVNTADSIYLIKELSFEGYNIDFATLENEKKINFEKYNIIITPYNGQRMTAIEHYEENKDDFKMINGIPFFAKIKPVMCFYTSNPKAPPSKDGEARYPFKALCGMSNGFMKEKNLQEFDKAGIIKPDDKEPTLYLLYKNTKLPLYLKVKRVK